VGVLRRVERACLPERRARRRVAVLRQAGQVGRARRSVRSAPDARAAVAAAAVALAEQGEARWVRSCCRAPTTWR
jgi:hypothetical protein